jgi:anti-anti-sigma factor
MSPLEGQVKDCCPVRWLDHGRQAIAVLPEHVDLSTAGPIREQLLALINRGAETLIADMTATISCDHAGADTLARVHQRAAASGTELRLVVTAPVVRRVLGITGLDRLVLIYPVLEAALAASRTAVVLPLVPRSARAGSAGLARPDGAGPVSKVPVAALRDSRATALTPAVLWQALDALPDGIALTDDTDGIALANRRLEEMFGYQHGELPGRPLPILVPASREMLPGARDGSRPQPPAPPLADGAAWLTGVRKNGTAFPVQISLTPVSARTGRFTLAVIRGSTDLDPDLAALAAQRQHLEETLDRITRGIFEVGITLSTTAGMSPDDLRNRIDEASRLLDDIVNGIHDAMFRGRRPRQADGR